MFFKLVGKVSLLLFALTLLSQAHAQVRPSACPFFLCASVPEQIASKKVFAHYFTPFPISLDNKESSRDYYAQNYLLPNGENSKYSFSGGFIKQRPMPRPPIQLATWAEWDYQSEIKKAAAIGIDGFAVDILSSEGTHWDRVNKLLDAAKRADIGFTMMLMPDMEGQFKTHPEKLVMAIRQLAKHPAVFRLDDGRIVLAPFNAQNQPPAWWAQLVAELNNDGIMVAMFPVFQGWQRYAKEYAGLSYGFSDWGVRSVTPNLNWSEMPKKAKAYGVKWMMPVSPQDARPKDLMYWEASNSSNYRTMWKNAITGDADWVQVITWNDYSESTEIAPSTGTGTAFYDLTSYYINWFKTAKKPVISQDAIYYFHRLHSTNSLPNQTKQPTRYKAFRNSDEPKDEIEFLAFLATPAKLEVRIGALKFTQQSNSGMVSFKVPLSPGRPIFSIVREGQATFSVESNFNITDSIEYQDLLYRSGGGIAHKVSLENQ